MPGIFGDTVPLVEQALRFRVARQGLLASNVANADTPGYRRSDLRFEAALERAESRLRRTDGRHFAAGPEAGPGWRLERERGAERPDGNGVNVDRELIALSRNAGAFTEQSAVLSRLVALTRTAITGETR